MFRITPVIRNLIIINVIVFIGQSIVPPLTNYIALWGVRTPYFLPYQLFTYMFAHADLGHIFWNMVLLIMTGPILEDFWGPKKFLLLYMAAGLGAAAFHMIVGLFVERAAFDMLIGASGAVYGVMTCYGIIFADMEVRILFFPISFKAKYIVLVLGSYTIFKGVMGSGVGDGVAHLTHLGGLIVGMVFIQYWRSRGRY